MSDNPYQSPAIPASEPMPPARAQALGHWRVALVILLIPALFNYYCFAFSSVGARAPLTTLGIVARLLDLLGIALIALLVWCVSLPALEWLIRLFQQRFARHTELSQWHAELYKALVRAPYFAVGGAVLWYVWVAGFYQARVNFFVISYAIGIPAHILAACLYVPLLCAWYRLCRQAREQELV